MTTTDNQIIVPFNVQFDPMKALLLTEFADGQEFDGFEPQLFDDSINGKGLRILRYRKDQKVDVYWEPGVKPMDPSFSIGAGLGDYEETVFKSSRFEINSGGITIDICFTDKQGREIKLYIEETKGFGGYTLLAPVGHAVKAPSRLFFALLHGFRFVRKAGTEFHAQIDGKTLTPTKSPVPGLRKSYSAKYSSNPLISYVNVPMDAAPVIDYNGSDSYNINTMQITVDGHQHITSLRSVYGDNDITLLFPDGFPNLTQTEQNRQYTGTWHVNISDYPVTGGDFLVTRQDDQVEIELDVTQHWKPKNSTLWIHVMPAFFRAWPASYRWNGTVNLSTLKMSGTWHRKTEQ